MKLTYVIPHGVYSQDKRGISKGVRSKLDAQIKSLMDNNVDVIPLYLPSVFTSPLALIRSYKDAYRTLSRLYSSNNTSEYIYIRYPPFPYTISYLLSFNKKRTTKIIYEMQDTGAYVFKNQTLFRKIQVLYLNLSEVMFSKQIVKSASALVSVTAEISEHYKHKNIHLSIPHLVLGNGIETNRYSIHLPPEHNQELHIICVAHVQSWHGIDRFIRGLHEHNAHYANSTKIVLHIVGDGPELPHLKDLTNNLGLNENVIFHGFKSGKKLDEMFDMCHIAIGSLAGFRVGLNELSSLKSREYCARGIPFLMASKDADFPDDFAWVQMVSANEDPLDMNLVINFAERVMSDPEHPQKMRKYAEENLDWMAKMRVLKEFLETL